MSFSDCINDFTAHLRRGGYSARTIRAYGFDLEKFSAYMNDVREMRNKSVGIDDIEKNHIKGWIDSLLEKGNTARTIARKIATLKSFYNYRFLYDCFVFRFTTDKIYPVRNATSIFIMTIPGNARWICVI